MVRSGVLESRGHVAQETRQAVHANDCTLRCSARTVWAPRSRLHRLLFFTDKRSRSGRLRGRDQEIHYSRTQSRRDIRSGSSSPCSLKERTTIPIGHKGWILGVKSAAALPGWVFKLFLRKTNPKRRTVTGPAAGPPDSSQRTRGPSGCYARFPGDRSRAYGVPP